LRAYVGQVFFIFLLVPGAFPAPGIPITHILLSAIILDKNSRLCFHHLMGTTSYLVVVDPWTFRPDIDLPNIKAKLPENPANILLSGRNALLING